MNNQAEVPKQINRWNWGAFLLTPFWCLRHGIWFGLLLIVPLFGVLVPFILGATGNQRAWRKNPNESVESFLKRQKFWGFAGLAIWMLTLVSTFGFLSYSLNYSEGMKMGLEIANTNVRLTQYFGKPIKKSSFFNASYNYVLSPKPSTLTIDFKATGPQNTGSIHFQWEKRSEDWVVTEMDYVGVKGETGKLVDSLILSSSFFEQTPYDKTLLESTLNRMMQEKEGNVTLLRSERYNDFIQTAIVILDDGSPAFSLEYSDGFTAENKKLYQSKEPIRTRKEILQIFSLYAMGSDAHIGSIKWNKLSAIKSQGVDTSFFIFGEPE